MIIIQEGKKFNREYCRKCDCEFLYTREELKKETKRGKDIQKYIYKYLFCPTCGEKIVVSQERK